MLPKDEKQAHKLAFERLNFKFQDNFVSPNPALPDCWQLAVQESLRTTLMRERRGSCRRVCLSFFREEALCFTTYLLLVARNEGRSPMIMSQLSSLCWPGRAQHPHL